MIAVSGTKAASRNTSLKWYAPDICRSGRTSTPSCSMTIPNMVTPARPGWLRSVRASRRAKSALRAFDVHTFWPVTDHPPSTSAANVWTLVRSDPASGSEISWHQLLVGAEREEHRRQHLERDGQHLGGHAVAALLLGDHLGLPRRAAVPAVLHRPGAAGPAGVEELTLPPPRDREGRVLLRLVPVRGRRRHEVSGREVLRARPWPACARRATPDLGPEGGVVVTGTLRARPGRGQTASTRRPERESADHRPPVAGPAERDVGGDVAGDRVDVDLGAVGRDDDDAVADGADRDAPVLLDRERVERERRRGDADPAVADGQRPRVGAHDAGRLERPRPTGGRCGSRPRRPGGCPATAPRRSARAAGRRSPAPRRHRAAGSRARRGPRCAWRPLPWSVNQSPPTSSNTRSLGPRRNRPLHESWRTVTAPVPRSIRSIQPFSNPGGSFVCVSRSIGMRNPPISVHRKPPLLAT